MSSTRSVTASRSLPVMVSVNFTASTSSGLLMNSSIGFLPSLRSGGADVGTRPRRGYSGDYVGARVRSTRSSRDLLRLDPRRLGRDELPAAAAADIDSGHPQIAADLLTVADDPGGIARHDQRGVAEQPDLAFARHQRREVKRAGLQFADLVLL